MPVLLKAPALLAAAFSLVSASPAIPDYQANPNPVYINYLHVRQVVCIGGMGTLFNAGGKFISVAHVTSIGGCWFNEGMADAPAEDGKDFSVLSAPAPQGFPIDCGGFRKGEYYYAVGHARGSPLQVVITLKATGGHSGGMAVLRGNPTVIPGMSGGPVLNGSGAVVGTVNAYLKVLPLSLSQELKATSLCRADRAA